MRSMAVDRTRAELQIHQAELEIQNEDLREAREQLSLANERYRSLFDLAPLGYLILDSEGRVRLANWTAVGLLGTPRRMLEGAFLSDLAHPDDAFSVQRHVLGAVSLRTKQCVEARFSGGMTILHLETIGVRGEGGRTEYRTALLDVTAQRQLDARLADREARLVAIVDHASEAIVTVDRFGFVEAFNSAAEELFGYRPAEIIGRPIDCILPGPHGERGEEHMHRYLRGRLLAPRGQQADGLRKDGTRIPVEVSLAELRRAGGGFVAILRDVRELDRLQRDLLRAQRTELVGNLCAGMVHDFNNVLNAVLVTTELALDDIGEADAVGRRLESLKGTVQIGSGLTRQMLEIARGRVAPIGAIRLDNTLARMIPLLRAMTGADVALQLTRGAPGLRVAAAPGHLEQVLMNLAANARDAMDGRGTLTIRTAQVEVGIEPATDPLPPGTYGRIDVTDTGCGMEARTAAHAFEPTFTTKGPGRGTGFGLASVRNVVSQLEGRVTFRTEPGRGTHFTIHLPAARGSRSLAKSVRGLARRLAMPASPPAQRSTFVQSEHSDDDTASTGTASQTVLLVEDHALTRSAMAEALTDAGYRVIEAATVHAAEEHVARADLIVADVSLPDRAGWELVGRARESRPDLPVLYVAGLSPVDDPPLQRALEADATACLVKPVSLDAFMQSVAQLTQRSA